MAIKIDILTIRVVILTSKFKFINETLRILLKNYLFVK